MSTRYSFIVSILLLSICLGEKSRLLDAGCICTKDYVPVCCDGVKYSNQCGADCVQATNCEKGECAIIACTLLPGTILKGSTSKECSTLKFTCDAGFESFNNLCGCGCIPTSCVCLTQFDPVCCDGVTYSNQCGADCVKATNCEKGECGSIACAMLPGWELKGTTEECTRIKFSCDAGFEYFSNLCGCGCKPTDDYDVCAATLCLPGTECVDNNDGTASCVEFKKKKCRVSNGCDDGFDCIKDPSCAYSVKAKLSQAKGKKVCATTSGSCGGFANAPCAAEEEECVYSCGTTLGTCVVYQYR